jgi:hypothetical protein
MLKGQKEKQDNFYHSRFSFSLRPLGEGLSRTVIRDGKVVQVVEPLPNKHEALCSNCNIAKQNKTVM